LLTRNSIYSIFFRDNNDGNVFLANNFWCGKVGQDANFFEFVGTNFWDNGSVGNYWSDYNGSDLNMDGIGDTPYFINNKAVEIVIAQDNYPLMAPYDIEHDTIVLPQTELFAAIIVVAVVVLVGAGLLVYFKKRKR
jgi:LPXTG-motif cell wall-anchored protein